MSVSHFKITQASLIAAFTVLVGNVVALVPSWAPEKSAIIQGGTFVIAGLFLLANSVHKLGDSNVSVKDVESGAIAAAKTKLDEVDFNLLVKAAVDAHGLPDLEAKVQAEVQHVLSRMFSQAAKTGATVPVAQAPPVAPPAV